MMSAPAMRIGDQLILEEDYDESYIPQEHEIQEYARLIGVDPKTEPELMWLAREGIVAPLTAEWKPCQDITGDIYYFNFATGQSTWDHPNDEHYRELVVQERERLQAQGVGKKKEKTKKKEKKKDKKAKDLPKPIPSLSSPLGPVQSSLGNLAPLRGLGDPMGGNGGGMRPSMSSSTGSSGGFDSLLSGTPGISRQQPSKLAPQIKSSTGVKLEEMGMNLAGLEEDEEGEHESEDQSPRGSARLFKNLHMDIGSLGGGFEYEDSEVSEDAKDFAASDHNKRGILDFGFNGQSLEKVLDISALSPGALSPKEILEELEEEMEEDVSLEENLSEKHMKKLSEEQHMKESMNKEHVFEKVKEKDFQELLSEPVKIPENMEYEEKEKENKSEKSVKVPVKEDENDGHMLAIEDEAKRPAHPDQESVESSEGSSISAAAIPKTVGDPIKCLSELPRLVVAPEKTVLELSKLAEEERKLEEEHRLRLRDLRESLRQAEEEESRELHLHQESRLRALAEKLEREEQEEKARLRESQKERLLKLESELNMEREAEAKRIRTQEEELRADLQSRMEQFEESQQELALQEKAAIIEKVKRETENAIREERETLLQERATMLQEINETLKQETKEALESLEKQQRQEVEQHRANMVRGRDLEISNTPDWQREDHKMPSDLHLNHKKMSQVLEYERELSDLMQEKRREVQRDHEKKLERLNEEHEQEIERLQNQHEEEERNLRSRMQESLREERGRMTRLHEQELETERCEMARRQEERHRIYQEKENRLQSLEQNQEIRRKQIEGQERQMDCQEENLRKRREGLDELEKGLAVRAKGLETSRINRQVEEETEQHLLHETVRKSHRELEETQNRKSELEAEVEILESRCTRLQKIISDLENEISKKRSELKEVAKEEMKSKAEPELRLEDLTPAGSAQYTEVQRPTQSVTQKPEDESNIDDLRHYISSQGASIQSAKDFLKLQSRSMCRRQSLLRAAKQQWRHDRKQWKQDPDKLQVLESVGRSLDEESRSLDEICSKMQKGQILLQKKEQHLQELENSLLEEVSEEDSLKETPSKKVVTFDLSDSEDTSSVTSNGLHRCFQFGSQSCFPVKIQHLSESLRRITADLNGVLTTLGPITSDRQPPLTHTSTPMGVPLSTYTSLTSLTTPTSADALSQSSWTNGIHSSFHTPSSTLAATKSVDAIMVEKWRKYFPGGSTSLSGYSQQTDNKLGYVSAEEQIRVKQSGTPRTPHKDSHSVQVMIDANKKWLENFRNDPKVPLFSRASKPPSVGSLLQLGLDENNQIKVYHY
ncbi:centrosomal protein of 164 kDa isoform 2-T3 [Discoglossus pictus]